MLLAVSSVAVYCLSVIKYAASSFSLPYSWCQGILHWSDLLKKKDRLSDAEPCCPSGKFTGLPIRFEQSPVSKNLTNKNKLCLDNMIK